MMSHPWVDGLGYAGESLGNDDEARFLSDLPDQRLSVWLERANFSTRKRPAPGIGLPAPPYEQDLAGVANNG